MTGIELIAAERQRQIEQEGWTPEHDDEHDAGELAAAGAAYAINASDQLHPYSQGDGCNQQPPCWPWTDEWWKPKDALSNLVRAGALIAGEIDKLQRNNSRNIPTKATMSTTILTLADGWPFPVIGE